MISINLIPENLRKTKKKNFIVENFLNLPKESIVVLVGRIMVPIFLIFVVLQISISVKFITLKKEKRQWQMILPEKKKTDQIIAEMRSFQSKIASLEKTIFGQRMQWSQKLNEISDSLSRGVWLNKLSVESKMLLIDGSAASKVKDEMVNVGNFVTNLKSRKNLMNDVETVELGSLQRRQIKTVDLIDFVVSAKLK